MINFFKVICPLICILFPTVGDGQAYQVYYNADIRTAEVRHWSGRTTLMFNDSVATFTHLDWPSNSDIYEENGNLKVQEGDTEGMKHYLNRNQGILIYKSYYGSSDDYNFIFTDTLPQIRWTIHPSTMKVGKYLSTKATGDFGGRSYTAWFAPEIPTSFGPLYFGGLPGLITKLNSIDGIVNYILAGPVTQAEDEAPNLSPPQDGKHITVPEFEEHIVRLLHKIEALSTDDLEMSRTSPPPDGDIIKDKWTIIRDYKLQRGY